jgi:hypothetical protein
VGLEQRPEARAELGVRLELVDDRRRVEQQQRAVRQAGKV